MATAETERAAIRARFAEIIARERVWRADLASFAGDALMIRPKAATPHKFRFNRVQTRLNSIIEEQKAHQGVVRVIIVKARQLGISSYVAARFYHRVRHDPGFRANITTHRDDATKNLLTIVRRFHEGDAGAPGVAVNNRSELVLANDSGFQIATAGAVATGTGRSFTFQLAHLSELALWQNAGEHLDAVMNAIPDVEGSEIIIESTAKGASGPFYSMVMDARRGASRFIPIFLAWHEHEEYAIKPPAGWQPMGAIRDLGRLYELSPDQMYWAETVNAERAAIDGDDPAELCWRFRQEYPSNMDEAFRASRRGGFIPASVVADARRRRHVLQGDMPLIIGCDFATGGGGGDHEHPGARDTGAEGGEDGDANVFISRRGRTAGHEIYDRFRDRDTLSVATRLGHVIERLTPARVFMDRGGGGAAVYDILAARGYSRVMELVDFGSSSRPGDRRKYRNRRSEMYGDMREWLLDGAIPDDDLLETEVTAPWVHRDDETGLTLAPKREIRSKLSLSPDGADALALTFAAPVRLVGGPMIRFRGSHRR